MKILSLCLCLIALSFPLTAETGAEIMQKVVENQKADSSALDISMSLIDSGGRVSERRIQTLAWEDGGRTKTITLFLEPAAVRNTRFLTIENHDRDDDRWIYLPSLRKVKRIAASEKDGSFMGSDFSYADISAQEVDEAVHILLREETLEGRHCYVVESRPTQQAESSYGKTVSWVDGETYLTVKVDLYAADAVSKVKEIVMEGLRQVQNRWIAEKITMKTLASGHSTVLETNQVKYDIPVNPGYFTTGFLQTGRIE